MAAISPITLRRCLFLLALISALTLLVLKWAGSGTTEDANHQLAIVGRRSFEITVNTVGVMDAERSHMISSRIKGDKGKIIYLVGDGARVIKGDILVKLDPSPYEEEIRKVNSDVQSLDAAVESIAQVLEWEKNQIEREIRTAEFNLKVAELDLRKLVEGDGPLQLIHFKEEMDTAREDYDRYVSYIDDIEKLIEKGYAHRTELMMAKKKSDEFKKKFDTAHKKYISYERHVLPSLVETGNAKVEAARMEIEQIGKGSVFKIAKSVAALNEAKAKRQSARELLEGTREKLGRTVMHAPYGGIAILYETFRDGQKRKPRVGDRVLQNQPLLYLPDIATMIVKTQVREVDLYKIRQSQKCLIKVDAYPDALLDGHVTHIGILAAGRSEGRMGEKYFQLVVGVNESNARLRPGMTARVSIMVDQVENALTVPVHAVFEKHGALYCYRRGKKGFEKVPVAMGRQNEDVTEIVSGLEVGDRVSLTQPAE